MAHIISTNKLLEALEAEGFPIPDHCLEARVIFSVDSAIAIEYDVCLTDEDLGKLGRALQRLAVVDAGNRE